MKKYTYILFLCLMATASNAQNRWWNQGVAYEVFVRSFYDSNADGIGDFAGLTQKLNYLNDGKDTTNSDLGVGLIWLMPVNASPSYHGYDVTNYLTLNPQYGNIAQFQTMLTQAHNKGIKVIMDLVINHTSDQHPWFVKSANNDPFYRNFYIWNNSPPSQTGPWGQQVWYAKNSSNYYALFYSGMPDLNYNYQPVKDSIFAAAKYWLKDIGVDGFRLDAAMYLFEEGNTLKNHPKTIAFWKEFNDSCESWKANSLLVGEVWDSPDATALYTGKLDMCFDFSMADANMQCASTANPYTSRLALENTKTKYDTNQFATFLTNHDQNRVIDVFSDNISKSKVVASCLLTQPGVPFIYYGEEIGMKGSKPDENIRRPMQWTAGTNAGFTTGTPWRFPNSNYASFNVEVEQADQNSLLSHYKLLIDLRNKYPALQTGIHKNIISSSNQVHSYSRFKAGANPEEFIVLINTGSTAVSNLQFNYKYQSSTAALIAGTNLFTPTPPYQRFYPEATGNNQFTFTLNLLPFETMVIQLENRTTGLNENAIDNNFIVYPNPNSGRFSIGSNRNLRNCTLEIYTYDGKLVYTNKILENQVQTQLLPGLYFLRLLEENSQSNFQKLLIE